MPAVRYSIEMVRGVPVVAAPEEIDASDADWLRAALLEAAYRGRATFVVDMTCTQFCTSAVLSALMRAQKRALAEGGELRVVIPANAAVRRVFAFAGLDRLIPTFPDLDRALALPAAAAVPRRPRGRPQRGCAPADRQPPGPGAEPSPA